MTSSDSPVRTSSRDTRPLLETDRAGLIAFLRTHPEENTYLLSRIAMDGVVNEGSSVHGRFYGHFGGEGLDGVAFFGHRKGVVLAGDSDAFLRDAAALALGEEADWIILVAARAAVDGFLSHYRWRGRPTHLNRRQEFYVLRPEDLAPPTVTVRAAEGRDLEAVIDMSAQMLAEDFDLPVGSLSREGIRETMRHRIRDGRTWVLEDAGEIVYKVDVGALFSGGAQIEGVFTRPERRGRGWATAGTAAVCAELLKTARFVTLHVDTENSPARRAYENAGFRRFSAFQLVLLEVQGS